LLPGAEVTVHIDADRRLLNARVHSAGHLLDVAMTNVGFGPDVMVPAKGLHTPEQAYVEYTGVGLDTTFHHVIL
jgi:Ser-tRNA(Ala) deacylase AlaX